MAEVKLCPMSRNFLAFGIIVLPVENSKASIPSSIGFVSIFSCDSAIVLMVFLTLSAVQALDKSNVH